MTMFFSMELDFEQMSMLLFLLSMIVNPRWPGDLLAIKRLRKK